MSRTHEGWIVTKTRKFSADGRLQIGQILAKPFEPESCLLPKGPEPVPNDVVADVTKESDVFVDKQSALTAMFNIWTETAAIPLEASIGAHNERSHTLTWHFESLESTQVSLPFEYVEKAMTHGEVPKHLKEWHLKDRGWNKRIFIITGLTLAKVSYFISVYLLPPR